LVKFLHYTSKNWWKKTNSLYVLYAVCNPMANTQILQLLLL
jgi:hypothetical protein